MFTPLSDPAWHADTLASDSVTAVGVDTVTLLLTVDAPLSRATVCSKWGTIQTIVTLTVVSFYYTRIYVNTLNFTCYYLH